MPVNISEITIDFDQIMATGSGNITDTGIVGEAILRIKNKDGGENVLKPASTSQFQTSSVKYSWSNNAKTLTLEPSCTLEYDTTYILRLSGYNKHLFGGRVATDLKFTTQPDPNAPTGLLRREAPRNDGQVSYSTNGQSRTKLSSEYSENSSKHGLALKLIAVLVGILPIALFLILDDLTSHPCYSKINLSNLANKTERKG